MRKDAERNRQRVIDAAFAAFAAEGLSVPVHEIARRAGVGTGTVSRHFPTKDALYLAIVTERVGRLVEQAHALAETGDPGRAFLDFFTFMVEEGAANRGMAEAFAGAGYDMERAAATAGLDVMGSFNDLLVSAQKAGAVRSDVDVADVKALMVGCLARERHPPDPAARRRIIDIATAGLRPLP